MLLSLLLQLGSVWFAVVLRDLSGCNFHEAVKLVGNCLRTLMNMELFSGTSPKDEKTNLLSSSPLHTSYSWILMLNTQGIANFIPNVNRSITIHESMFHSFHLCEVTPRTSRGNVSTKPSCSIIKRQIY
nr:uncharacterized protein LOC104099456 isoform X2 [Nicotiana tomentosiformis]